MYRYITLKLSYGVQNTRNFEIGTFDFHEMVLIVHNVLYKDQRSNDKWQTKNITNDKLKQFTDHF